LLVVLLFVGCSFSKPEPIVLFVFKDQSDTPSLNPTRLVTGSQLAQEEHSRRLSLVQSSGNLPKMVYITYQGPEDNGVQKAREFLQANPRVVAIVGDINSQGTRLLANLAQEFNLFHMSFFATDESIFEEHPLSFSYRERISNETNTLLTILNDRVGVRAPVFLVNDLQNLATRWQDLSQALVVNNQTRPEIISTHRNQIDFTQELVQINQLGQSIDSIVLFLSTQQHQHFLQQAAIQKVQVPIIMSGVSLDPDHFIEFSGLDLEMYSFTFRYFMDLYQNTNPTLEQFSQRYQIAMGLRRVDSLGPWIYDGILLLLEALSLDSSGANLLDHFSLTHHDRLVGTVFFNSEGNLSHNTFIPIRLEQGRIREICR
jgi:hypothetical protein